MVSVQSYLNLHHQNSTFTIEKHNVSKHSELYIYIWKKVKLIVVVLHLTVGCS